MSGTGPEPVLHRSGTGLGPVPDRSCIGAGPLRHWSGTGPGPIHLGNPSVYLCAGLLSEAPVGTVLPKTSFKPPYAQEFLCSLTGTICRRFSETPIYIYIHQAARALREPDPRERPLGRLPVPGGSCRRQRGAAGGAQYWFTAVLVYGKVVLIPTDLAFDKSVWSSGHARFSARGPRS